MTHKKITIVVPVYGDWPSLSDCIESLKEYVSAEQATVLFVNDCGPEWKEIEANITSAIAGYSNFVYEKNPDNLGFVQNCNRAVLELDQTQNDILLLNSDTKVTAGFLDAMVEVLYSDDSNGVVTPRSNNATLATVPLRAASQKGIDQDESYALYQEIKDSLPQSVIVPVAHGFCMLIRRECIRKYGLFDEVFGKGYGEEVDFCLRIREGGYKCLLANHAFVFHQEAKSFSLETKSKLLEENNKIIWQRYPTYRQEVRDYMSQAVANEDEIEARVLKKPLAIKDRAKNTLKKSSIVRRLAARVRR